VVIDDIGGDAEMVDGRVTLAEIVGWPQSKVRTSVKGSGRRGMTTTTTASPGGESDDNPETKKEEKEEEDACWVARGGRSSCLYSLRTMCVGPP
jgi:hypothetical protein